MKAKLKAQLAKAYDVWRSALADQKGQKQQRYAQYLALTAFVEWARAEGDIPAEHMKPLVNLGLDLSEPTEHEKGGNPGAPLLRIATLASACAAIDVLSGGRRLKVGEVVTDVARRLGMEAGALRSWRGQFKSGRIKDVRARPIYDQMMHIFKETADPVEAAYNLLRRAK